MYSDVFINGQQISMRSRSNRSSFMCDRWDRSPHDIKFVCHEWIVIRSRMRMPSNIPSIRVLTALYSRTVSHIVVPSWIVIRSRHPLLQSLLLIHFRECSIRGVSQTLARSIWVKPQDDPYMSTSCPSLWRIPTNSSADIQIVGGSSPMWLT